MTALMVLLVAGLAGMALWALRAVHAQAAHAEAARSVLNVGARIAAYLAAQPALRAPPDESAPWESFSRQVRALHAVEEGLQYVSVSRDGVTVFHEQTSALDGSAPAAAAPSRELRMTRRLLGVGDGAVPVFVFAQPVAGADGRPVLLEIGLRREAVAREEQALAAAIASMFRVALATIVVSFASCLVLVVWALRREGRREAQRRQEEHLAFAGLLANGIAHDFRNPMSALRLDVQLLQREAARGAEARPERLAELAERARQTVDRMDKVFQEFLDLSHPGDAAPAAVDLGACVRDCLALLAARFEHAGVRGELQIEAPEPVQVLAQRQALQRALVNVLTNAEQFSPRGAAVSVRIRREGRQAVLEVLDRGPGIPAAEQDRIFEMFVSRRPGGTGLGLFLARTAVERCGGAIRAENRPEGGACFRITLPLVSTPS